MSAFVQSEFTQNILNPIGIGIMQTVVGTVHNIYESKFPSAPAQPATPTPAKVSEPWISPASWWVIAGGLVFGYYLIRKI